MNGQKIWTSFAHLADYCYLVARTNPEVPKHKGISEFIVDMKTPGITVKPIVDMTGAHHFNEVFFDQVRVPKSCPGWREGSWLVSDCLTARLRTQWDRALDEQLSAAGGDIAYAKETGLNRSEIVRQRLAQLHIEFTMGKFLVYKVAWLLSRSIIPNAESAAAKAFCTEFEQRLAQTASELLGGYSQLMPGSPRATCKGASRAPISMRRPIPSRAARRPSCAPLWPCVAWDCRPGKCVR